MEECTSLINKTGYKYYLVWLYSLKKVLFYSLMKYYFLIDVVQSRKQK